MECRSARETEVLGENVPQRHFCSSQSPTWPDLGLNSGRRGGTVHALDYSATVTGRDNFTFTLHGVTSRNTALFIATAVIFRNLNSFQG
jgi:hypothetical protein